MGTFPCEIYDRIWLEVTASDLRPVDGQSHLESCEADKLQESMTEELLRALTDSIGYRLIPCLYARQPNGQAMHAWVPGIRPLAGKHSAIAI